MTAPREPMRPLLLDELIDGVCCCAILEAAPQACFRPARLASTGRRNHEMFRFDAALAHRLQTGLEQQFAIRCACDDLIETYRYAEGQHIDLHIDSPRRLAGGRMSDATLLIYLNDGFDGGRTLFPSHDLAVAPRAGNAVLFAHGVPHAAEAVRSGVKFIARLSVAYANGSNDSPGRSAKQSCNMR